MAENPTIPIPAIQAELDANLRRMDSNNDGTVVPGELAKSNLQDLKDGGVRVDRETRNQVREGAETIGPINVAEASARGAQMLKEADTRKPFGELDSKELGAMRDKVVADMEKAGMDTSQFKASVDGMLGQLEAQKRGVPIDDIVNGVKDNFRRMDTGEGLLRNGRNDGTVTSAELANASIKDLNRAGINLTGAEKKEIRAGAKDVAGDINIEEAGRMAKALLDKHDLYPRDGHINDREMREVEKTATKTLENNGVSPAALVQELANRGQGGGRGRP